MCSGALKVQPIVPSETKTLEPVLTLAVSRKVTLQNERRARNVES